MTGPAGASSTHYRGSIMQSGWRGLNPANKLKLRQRSQAYVYALLRERRGRYRFMKVLGHALVFVICDPSHGGCGWYWQKRTVQDHWWSRPRIEYKGPYWEHRDNDDVLSKRPGHQARWVNAEDWDAGYGDCSRHLAEVSLMQAMTLSAQRN